MGDVAMTVPVVRALTSAYPDLRVTVLSRPWAEPLFRALGPQVGFVGADLKKPGGRHRGLMGLHHLYYDLLQPLGITHVADMHSVLRSHVLRLRFRLAGVRVARIDKHHALRRQLCHEGAEAFAQKGLHLPTVFEAYADCLSRLGFPVDLSDPQFHTPLSSLRPQAMSPGSQEAPHRSTSHQRQIGLAPFATHPGKELPLPVVEQVMTLLLSRPDVSICLFGRGERESRLFPLWQERWPARIVIASETCSNILDELLLMSHLSAMLSMDSANQHLASLVGTRVVSVWGQTHPAAGFAPWRQLATDSLQSEMPCRPCSVFGNRKCRLAGVAAGTFPCLQRLEAAAIARQLLTSQTMNYSTFAS